MLRKLAIAFLFVLVLNACTPGAIQTPLLDPTVIPQPVPIQRSYQDGLGRMVTLPIPAQRIVSLMPSGTEILFAVKAGSQVVGRDTFSDYPAEAASVQDIGGSWGEYNLEAIVALAPDIVLAGGINTPELVAALEDLGLAVYFMANPLTLEDMYASLDFIGTLTGHEIESAELVESLAARVAAVDAAIKPINDRPTVFYELDASNPNAPFTAGQGTFIDLLIVRAGGQNIGADLQGQWAAISVEQLLVVDPAFILLGDAAWGETPEKVGSRPGWEVLSAVKNGQVFAFDDNLVSRPGPRLVDGLEGLVQILHPGVLK
jgi:iron complex transport system substrate-binding protein